MTTNGQNLPEEPGSQIDGPSALVACRIDADFAFPELGQDKIVFITVEEWMKDLRAGASARRSEEDLVCIAGGRSFPVPMGQGVEQAIVTVASALQDEVMDHLNRPWPQVGAGRVVLEPRVDEAGLAVWSSPDGQVKCPVGYLASSLGVLGQMT